MSAEVISMVVKKAGGKIYGAVLTAAEKKAMNMEIERQLRSTRGSMRSS